MAENWPNPTLRSLDVLVGTWNVSGEAHGQVTFEWMEGGFFLIQRIDLGDTKGIEIIGYDAASGTLRSHFYGSMSEILEYVYEVDDRHYIVSIHMPGREGQFRAVFRDDHNVIDGRWDWIQNGEHMGYNATLTRVR